MISPFFRRTPPSKPVAQPKPGIIGEKGYSNLSQMKSFAKKSPYKSYSKLSSKKLSPKERMGLIDKWVKEAKRPYRGLSTNDYNRLIIKKKKELVWAPSSKKKELKIEIDTMESFKKGT